MSTPILAPVDNTVKIISGDDLWSGELATQLKDNKLTRLNLPSNLTAQAFLIAHLPPTYWQRGVVWFLPSHRQLPEAMDLVRWWLAILGSRLSIKISLFEFPQDFISWLNYDSASLLLVAKEHLDLALPAIKEIEQTTIKLKINQIKNPLTVINQLLAAGYEPGPLPDSSGWYQKRGSMLIVSSRQGHWRFNWYNNRLEKIEEFAPESNLTTKILPQVAIAPYVLNPSPNHTLVSYLSALHCLIGPPEDFLPKHRCRLSVKLTANQPLFGGLPLFAKQWPMLTAWLREKINNQEKINFLTTSPNRLLGLLPPNSPPPATHAVSLAIASSLSGFTDKSSGQHYLTDRELYGPPPPRPKRSLAAYEKIKTNDFLVHIDHGIGCFGGLKEKSHDGIVREYFLIEYAEADKLYVPIEHTDRLSRYLGSPNPPLERLSSVHWFNIRKKVKAETTALAGELLKLYAQRHLARITSWQTFPEEILLATTFPYPLTPDQLKTWAEIEADLSSRQPMDRLICGDVGFGKTELAIRAAAKAAFNGYQTALLAPTTILAQQHFDTFNQRLSNYGLRLGLVSRAQTLTSIKQTLSHLKEGKINIIIGTHRLLGPDINFRRLGLLIIDEEQRFGVKQKEKLRALKPSVHTLALSATPIPRTLNLAVSSLRDLSLILSPPVGRQAVKMIFGQDRKETIKKAIVSELARHGQIYYLVPRIADLPAAAARLKKILPRLKLDIIHGQKSPRQVADTMYRFDKKELELLLATSIIENGIDLPNVNTIIVENAQKFGLADLYQLKGRVGRGSVKAYAYFLTSGKQTSLSEKRLEALAQTEELGGGLSLALKDLELRGAGAVLGREQHGQVSAVGLHLYGQMLAEAIEEQRSGQSLPAIPEVRLSLPLEGRISSELVPDEEARIHLYQRLASIREPKELILLAEDLLGRTLSDSKDDRLMKNLLTLLEIKLLAEQARLQEVTCWPRGLEGKFFLRFLETPSPETIKRLADFDNSWHATENAWQAEHLLAAGVWIPWLKSCLKQLQN